MANRRKDTMQIRQILRLHKLGLSNRQIAIELSIHRNTINSYVRLFKQSNRSISDLLALPPAQLMALFPKAQMIQKGRYEILSSYFTQILKDSKQVGFTLQNAWEWYKTKDPGAYGYTQFVKHYKDWLGQKDVHLKLHHKAGEKLMIDYTGKKLHWIDKSSGELIEVEVFVGVLPSSGYLYAEASSSQNKFDFISSMQRCLSYIGGVPKVLICDNLKSAVSQGSKYEATLNRTFRDMADHYGCAINPTRPYRPKDKAMVERMVQLVYQQIFYKLRNEHYYSLHQLNERIRELLNHLNDRPFKGIQISRREMFLQTELACLSPLPPQGYSFKEFQRAKVQKNSHVYMSADKHYYSVPYRYIGHHVKIHYTSQIVEVYYYHQRIACHKRQLIKSAYSTKKEHLPSTHQFYLDWNPDYFKKMAQQIGPYTTQYINRLFSQPGYTETKYKRAMGVIQLIKKYPRERLEKSCRLALLHPESSYKRILHILDKKLDQQADLFTSVKTVNESHIPQHQNIRGANYYQV